MYRRLIAALALLAAGSAAQEAPGIVWAKTVDSYGFSCIRQYWDGTLIIGGSDAPVTLYWMDLDGTVTYEDTIPGFNGVITSIAITAAGDIAVAGTGTFSSRSADTALLLALLSSSHEILWTRMYDNPGSSDAAIDVEVLPCGGFAVCGYMQEGTNTQAWILRTDSLGDTLWTRTWGYSGYTYPDKARTVEYCDEGITVLIQGRPQGFPAGLPVFARYDLDGDLLWTTTDLTGSAYDMCSADPFGYAVLRAEWPGYHITRCDETGAFMWDSSIQCDGGHAMASISLTQDGGFLVAGKDDDLPGEPVLDDYNAHLSRYDQAGGHLWTLSIENGQYYPDGIWDPSEFRDAVQLAEGGYVACGNWSQEDEITGYVVRIEPETGIGVLPGREVGLDLNTAVPNPGCTTFSLSWASVEAGRTSLRFFDLSGRLVDEVDQGTLPSGPHSIIWEAEDLPSGCYLVLLECGGERASSRLVIIR